MTNREFDKQMNTVQDDSGLRGHESTVKGCNVTREYEVYDVAADWRKERYESLNLNEPCLQSKDDLDYEMKILEKILQTQNNEHSNCCGRDLKATEEELHTIETIVIENQYNHMTGPQIRKYLDNTEYFTEGHVISVRYFSKKAKELYKQKKFESHTKEQRELFVEWTDNEDAKLIALHEEMGNKWTEIAEQMNEKTDTHCRNRWINSLDPNIKNGEWTDDEDAKLVALHEEMGNKWAEISKKMNGRTDVQCRKRWAITLDPSIKNGEWTDDEDAKLVALHEEMGNKWARIAKQMNGRTDLQCRNRWINSLDPNISNFEWTDDEDAKLIALHEEMGNKWAVIAEQMNGRTNNQCRQRWIGTLDPSIASTEASIKASIKNGEWTDNEDAKLVALHEEMGNKWARIAKQMNGRTNMQCRRRWFNSLDPNIKNGEWTKEEDAKLVALHEEMGNKWEKIAKQLNGRTDSQCRKRLIHMKERMGYVSLSYHHSHPHYNAPPSHPHPHPHDHHHHPHFHYGPPTHPQYHQHPMGISPFGNHEPPVSSHPQQFEPGRVTPPQAPPEQITTQSEATNDGPPSASFHALPLSNHQAPREQITTKSEATNDGPPSASFHALPLSNHHPHPHYNAPPSHPHPHDHHHHPHFHYGPPTHPQYHQYPMGISQYGNFQMPNAGKRKKIDKPLGMKKQAKTAKYKKM